MLRTYLALLGAGQKAYDADGGKKNHDNPADPYMTLLGYFNSLRELGGSRRIVEDEVNTRLTELRQRASGSARRTGPFADRDDRLRGRRADLAACSTNKVAEAKRRLALRFHEKDRVDVAIATNMISVGLDITRLGLMVVLGQPKTSAEYIQATSRVGRDAGTARPGGHAAQHPPAPRPLALRAVRGLPPSRSTAPSRRRASRRSRPGPSTAGWPAPWSPWPAWATRR